MPISFANRLPTSTKGKPRVVFVTSNPPDDEMGGSMLLFRQFVLRDDYDLFVITDRPAFQSEHFRYLKIVQSFVVGRLLRTRLSTWVHDFIQLTSGWWIPRGILKAAKDFKPDLIMIGAETVIAEIGIALARKLNLPLVGHFMDWPTFAMAAHPWVKEWASQRFQARYRACDLAFTISPEMKHALGPHENAQVFYPSRDRPSSIPAVRHREPGEPFRILFAGNLGQWYGRMIFDLAKTIVDHPELRLVVAGKNGNWRPDEEQWLRDQGIFIGFVKGPEYQALLEEADCLLVCMGFEPEARRIESTSFKSKLVDYLVSGRPVLVWGPEYCTAARHAREHGFALSVTSSDPQPVIDTAFRMISQPDIGTGMLEKALKYFDRFLVSDRVFGDAYAATAQLVGGITFKS
jgi:hypothetical protein